MRANKAFLLTACLLAAAATGCKPKPRPAPKPVQPLSFAQVTPDATVKLTIAPAIAKWPQLSKKLYDEGVAELKKDMETAREDRAHIAGEGFPNPVYEHQLSWSLSASTPRLVSLKGTWFSYTGGAHPNNGFNSLIWDTNLGQAINRSELFLPQGPGDQAVQQALCDGIGRARAAKGVPPDSDPSTWPCPKWRESDLALVPSTTPGKLGGVDFLFDPYAIGPYAEGPYEVVVPYGAIRGVLAPAYAGEFAGAPRPAPQPPAKAQG
jgi:hypothetical protein